MIDPHDGAGLHQEPDGGVLGADGLGTWPNVPVFITEYGATGTRTAGHGAPGGGDDPAWTAAATALSKS